MTTPTLTRRAALTAVAAIPAALALPVAPARAAAPMQADGNTPFHRFRLGEMEVTTLLAGSRLNDTPREIFGLNVDEATFAAASEAAFIPTDRAMNFFTPTLVNTGAQLILFDTGLDPAGITAALAAAGYTPDQVDLVVLTHMHGDHIGGLSGEAGPTFAKASYVAGAAEHNHWSGTANEGFAAKVKPLSDRTTMLEDGGTVAPGITAMLAAGHTPGHMVFQLESAGQRLLLGADMANHYVWSLAHPDWEVRYDMDKAQAAQARRRLLGMLAADRVPFIGYHMPFPGVGFVEAVGEGFRFVPHSYQMML